MTITRSQEEDDARQIRRQKRLKAIYRELRVLDKQICAAQKNGDQITEKRLINRYLALEDEARQIDIDETADFIAFCESEPRLRNSAVLRHFKRHYETLIHPEDE